MLHSSPGALVPEGVSLGAARALAMVKRLSNSAGKGLVVLIALLAIAAVPGPEMHARSVPGDVVLLDQEGQLLAGRGSLFGQQALAPGELVEQTVTAQNPTSARVTLWVRARASEGAGSPLWASDDGVRLRITDPDGGGVHYDGPAHRVASADVPILLPPGQQVRFTLAVGLSKSMPLALVGERLDLDFVFLTSDD